jgi:hypothetical protein
MISLDETGDVLTIVLPFAVLNSLNLSKSSYSISGSNEALGSSTATNLMSFPAARKNRRDLSKQLDSNPRPPDVTFLIFFKTHSASRCHCPSDTSAVLLISFIFFWNASLADAVKEVEYA